MKQLLAMVLCLLLLTIALGGCLQQADPARTPFVGSWWGTFAYGNGSRVPANMTFEADGRYRAVLPLVVDEGTWSVTGSILTKVTSGKQSLQYRVSFSQNSAHLVLTALSGNEEWNLTKR